MLILVMNLENATGKLLETGILGAIIIILGSVIVYLYKEAQQTKVDRLNDWINHENQTNLTIIEIKVFMQRILDLIQTKKDA